MKIYCVDKIVDNCATETLNLCATKEIAEREYNRVQKKLPNAFLQINVMKLIVI